MRVRIELEDGTIITIERPGRGRIGIRSIVTQDGQGPGDPSGESPWLIQAQSPAMPGQEGFEPFEIDEDSDAGPAREVRSDAVGEGVLDAPPDPGPAVSFRAAEGLIIEGGHLAGGDAEDVIDAGPAPGVGNRQEVVFTQRVETPAAPTEGPKKRRRKKS